MLLTTCHRTLLSQFAPPLLLTSFSRPCRQVSTILGAAIPEERAKNGYKEGIAIWVAILLVTGVGKQQLVAT
jgi:hypothetical protein